MPKHYYIDSDGKKNVEDVDMEFIKKNKFVYGGMSPQEQSPAEIEAAKRKKMKVTYD